MKRCVNRKLHLPPIKYFSKPEAKRTKEHSIFPKDISTAPIRLLIPLNPNDHIPWKLRQAFLDKLCSLVKETDSVSPIQIEESIHKQAHSKQVYQSLVASCLVQLRKIESFHPAPLKIQKTLHDFSSLICSPESLLSSGYFLQPEIKIINKDATNVKCCRCLFQFDSTLYYKSNPKTKCPFHPGRKEKVAGERRYTCCHLGLDSDGCSMADEHVYNNYLHPSVIDVREWPEMPTQHSVVALDAEMVYTQGGMEIARISAVNEGNEVILDLLVDPIYPIVDYNTRFSGITKEMLDVEFISADSLSWKLTSGLRVTFQKLIQEILPFLIGPQTILIGHSLENDLKSLGIISSRIIDTALLYPRDLSLYKYSLRDLSRKHLAKFIQDGHQGHDSLEDARMCLELVKLKLSC